jgi:hypothetical protein
MPRRRAAVAASIVIGSAQTVLAVRVARAADSSPAVRAAFATALFEGEILIHLGGRGGTSLPRVPQH